MAPTNLFFDSLSIQPSSANVIVVTPGNIDEAPSRTCPDGSIGVKTLDEATQTVRDLIAGRSQEIEIVSTTDKCIRKAVAGELLASLSRVNIEEREQARRLFLDHGYLADSLQELGTAELPNERAMAARALGLIASPRAIMSLANALLDDAAEVRHAAEQALAQITGPVVADLGALLEKELNLESAEVVESYIGPTSVTSEEMPFQNLTIEGRMVEKAMSEAIEVKASAIRLEEEAVQKAMRELKYRLFDAEDLTRNRKMLVQRAMEELDHRLLEAEELTRKRVELEAAQLAEVHAARCAEAEQGLRESEETREKELALLRSEVDSFQQDLDVITQQRAGLQEARLETEAQRRRLDEEIAELEAAVEARRAGVKEVRLEVETQIGRFDEEKTELEAAIEAQRAGVEAVRLETEAQIRRFDEEKAELEAVVEARHTEADRLRIKAGRQRVRVEEVRLEAEAQIRRFDAEKAELEAAVEARQAEAERLRMEAERQLKEAENRSRAEQEQFSLQTADLERMTDEVAHRRAEVEASLHKANEEDARLLEMLQATQKMRLETEAQTRRFDQEKVELEATVEARQAEVERLRIEAERQLCEAENRSRAEVEQRRLETEAQIQRFAEEKAELEATVEARKAEVERLRIEAERQLSEENRSRAEVEAVRLETEAQIRRFAEEKAELEAAGEARQAEAERFRIEAQRQRSEENRSRAEVEQLRLETEAQIQRFAEEKAELEAAVKARQAEAERLRIEAQRQLSEAENRCRAEQEQFLLERADFERLTEEVAHRRAEVEVSLHKALEEDLRVLELQKATEQSRHPDPGDVLWLEPEICQRTEIDQRLLEETHLHAQDLQRLIEEEARRSAYVDEQEELVEKGKSVAVSRVS